MQAQMLAPDGDRAGHTAGLRAVHEAARGAGSARDGEHDGVARFELRAARGGDAADSESAIVASAAIDSSAAPHVRLNGLRLKSKCDTW